MEMKERGELPGEFREGWNRAIEGTGELREICRGGGNERNNGNSGTQKITPS